jgi:hypothetical protein
MPRNINRLIAVEFHATIFIFLDFPRCIMRIGSMGKNICCFTDGLGCLIGEESACIINIFSLWKNFQQILKDDPRCEHIIVSLQYLWLS